MQQPYGVFETNPLTPETRAERNDALHGPKVPWTDPDLAEITRLRLLTDPGFPAWEVSYCTGLLRDGTGCRVELPFDMLPKGRGRMKGAILAHARRDHVFANGLHVFDAISTLN